MDEAGDVWYGSQCYIVAYKEQCQRAITTWVQQAKQHTRPQNAEGQTDPDLTQWVTPTPSPEDTFVGSLLQVEQVAILAESDAYASQNDTDNSHSQDDGRSNSHRHKQKGRNTDENGSHKRHCTRRQ